MKKVSRFVPDVPQKLGDRGSETVERVLSAYGVARARDLPEEGKVRLHRELSLLFENELPDGLILLRPSDFGWRGVVKRRFRALWQALTRRRRC